MRIAVLGAGAMGCLFGGLLKNAGQDVVLIDVWAEHIEAINKERLRLDTDEASQRIDIPARFIEQVRERMDLVILFTKGMHTEQALHSAAHILGEQTHLLTLQNGFGQVDIAKTMMDVSRIIHGITTYPCDLIGPGHVRSKGRGQIKFMSVDANHYPMLDILEDAFQTAGLEGVITPNVEEIIWEKIAFNAALNALTAVTGLTVGQVGDSKEGIDIASAVVNEVTTVANGNGIHTDSKRVLSTLGMAFAGHRDHQPSMLQDRLAKRKTEIDFINGAVIREARKLDIAVPVTETLYSLVRMLEESYLQ
jgi:2-dehydropantoate 2-reductase